MKFSNGHLVDMFLWITIAGIELFILGAGMEWWDLDFLMRYWEAK